MIPPAFQRRRSAGKGPLRDKRNQFAAHPSRSSVSLLLARTLIEKVIPALRRPTIIPWSAHEGPLSRGVFKAVGGCSLAGRGRRAVKHGESATGRALCLSAVAAGSCGTGAEQGWKTFPTEKGDSRRTSCSRGLSVRMGQTDCSGAADAALKIAGRVTPRGVQREKAGSHTRHPPLRTPRLSACALALRHVSTRPGATRSNGCAEPNCPLSPTAGSHNGGRTRDASRAGSWIVDTPASAR